MNRSYIVHGPTGCGKSQNAERMAAALGLTKVQDNWSPMDQVFEPFDTLYLTASEGPWPDQARHVLSFAEAMGRVPDAVVEPKSRYIHRNGVEYEVVMIANGESTSPKYPPTIVYRGVANGKVWARPACDWDRSMQLVERPASAKVEGTEQVSSTWLAQLRSEYRQFAEADEKMQSTLARVAELERALQTVVNAADHGSWPTTVMHGIEVAREVLAGPSAQTQPSPAPTLRAAIDVANDRFEVPVAKWGTDLIGEEERPEVVAFIHERTGAVANAEMVRAMEEGSVLSGYSIGLVTLARYDRDVGALRFERQQMDRAFTACINERDAANARLHEVATACATAEQERDAALARVAELENQEPVAWMDPRSPEMHATISNEVKQHNMRIGNASASAVNGYSIPLYAAPVAQAQHSVPDGLRELLEILVVSDLRKIRYAGAWRREVHNRASSILALLAAAPASSEES
ncbi:hypothetical protein [Pseudomonas aeruginosa]|uniref:hypothetical protein n=1 Tax=Pseudomonas aeruginosa TaxID=287 RepID=UPI000A90F5BD|nr:hypothetical protein [Pseudomonas aeruginosa]HDP3384648.1 hypothetical protein [Pseudomonas aeruginosa]HDQ1907367.1 hypothetical protein [Pseudomonas aeruginosa]HDQ4323583.1 hypothetical protein [Pseudomonas aeruginosa]